MIGEITNIPAEEMKKMLKNQIDKIKDNDMVECSVCFMKCVGKSTFTRQMNLTITKDVPEDLEDD